MSDTSLEDWWRPLSEPVLPRSSSTTLAASSGGIDDPGSIGDPEKDELEWYAPFSEPVRPLSSHAALAAGPAPDDQELIGFTATDESTEWWVEWPSPTLLAVRVQIPTVFVDPVALDEEGAAPAPAAGGGYTPYSVYDPGPEGRRKFQEQQEREEAQLETRREDLRQEREKLRTGIERLMRGEEFEEPPSIVTVPKKLAKGKQKTAGRVLAPVDTTVERAAVARRQGLETRRARLEVVQNELQGLGQDLKALARARARERLEAAALDEEERLMLLLLMS